MAASQLAEANARDNQLQAERDSSGMRQVGQKVWGAHTRGAAATLKCRLHAATQVPPHTRCMQQQRCQRATLPPNPTLLLAAPHRRCSGGAGRRQHALPAAEAAAAGRAGAARPAAAAGGRGVVGGACRARGGAGSLPGAAGAADRRAGSARGFAGAHCKMGMVFAFHCCRPCGKGVALVASRSWGVRRGHECLLPLHSALASCPSWQI